MSEWSRAAASSVSVALESAWRPRNAACASRSRDAFRSVPWTDRASPLNADAGVRGHEPRVGRQRVAAQPGPPAVPQPLHGVPGGRADARPPDQEGPAGAAQDGGQFPQVGDGGRPSRSAQGLVTIAVSDCFFFL